MTRWIPGTLPWMPWIFSTLSLPKCGVTPNWKRFASGGQPLTATAASVGFRQHSGSPTLTAKSTPSRKSTTSVAPSAPPTLPARGQQSDESESLTDSVGTMEIHLYEVGGCVRDELLGIKTKDIDFAAE